MNKLLRKIRYRLVFNRSRRLNKHGEGLIQIECQQDKRKIYFSTHVYCKPEEWKEGCIINSSNGEHLNFALYIMIQDIERIELEYIKRGVNVTLPLMKEAVLAHASPAAKLVDFGLEVVEQSERKNLTKANYKTLFNDLDRFKKVVLITDIDYNFISRYDKWLRERVSHNTRVSRLGMLRALMNEAKNRDIIDVNPFERFKIQQMVSKKGYVTAEQLKRFEKLIGLTPKEELIRDAFLVGCYTGLRYSDIVTLRKEHIHDGWITKKMVKTQFVVEIPIRKLFGGKMMDIIEKYKGDISLLTGKIPANQQVNQILKPLLARVNADAKITFHSSRHTFATLLGEKNVDITVIQHLLGHQKLQTTQIYKETNKSIIEKGIK